MGWDGDVWQSVQFTSFSLIEKKGCMYILFMCGCKHTSCFFLSVSRSPFSVCVSWSRTPRGTTQDRKSSWGVWRRWGVKGGLWSRVHATQRTTQTRRRSRERLWFCSGFQWADQSQPGPLRRLNRRLQFLGGARQVLLRWTQGGSARTYDGKN